MVFKISIIKRLVLVCLLLAGLSCSSDKFDASNSNVFTLINSTGFNPFSYDSIALYLPTNMSRFPIDLTSGLEASNQMYKILDYMIIQNFNLEDVDVFLDAENGASCLILMYNNEVLFHKRGLDQIQIQVENLLRSQSDSQFEKVERRIIKKHNGILMKLKYLLKGENEMFFSVSFIKSRVGMYQVFTYSFEDIDFDNYLLTIGRKQDS